MCRSGTRSAIAARWLQGEGFNAQNLDGGMQAWAHAGLDYRAGDGGLGRVAEPEPPHDDRPPELQEVEAGFLDLILAAQEHFGDRQPSEEEVRVFLRDRLLSEGKSPEEADEFLARMGHDDR